jgi:spermidine synthase
MLSAAAAPLAIAATGFGGMVYNMTLTFAFQALYGYVYLWIGLLVSVFMAGAAGASLLFSRGAGPVRRTFLGSELSLVVFSAILPISVQALARSTVPDSLMKAAFLILCLVSGALTGAQFPLACRMRGPGMASLYSCDLLGGWLGAVAGGAVLLPVLGLQDVCFFAALLKLASLALCAAALPKEER